MTYLEKCQKSTQELASLTEDFRTIAENTAVDIAHRYQLLMADACLGRIRQLFDEMNISFVLESWDPRILGYGTCINLTQTEIEYRLRSLSGLTPSES